MAVVIASIYLLVFGDETIIVTGDGGSTTPTTMAIPPGCRRSLKPVATPAMVRQHGQTSNKFCNFESFS